MEEFFYLIIRLHIKKINVKVFDFQVFSEGKRRAQSAFKNYTNVDMLRPYFDVEPYEVLKRLGRAFVPVNPRFTDQSRTVSLLYLFPNFW